MNKFQINKAKELKALGWSEAKLFNYAAGIYKATSTSGIKAYIYEKHVQFVN